MQQHVLKAPPSLATYLDAALVRVGYLLPEFIFERSGDADEVTVYLPDTAAPDHLREARKEFYYALYREKIHAETLEIRKRLTAC